MQANKRVKLYVNRYLAASDDDAQHDEAERREAQQALEDEMEYGDDDHRDWAIHPWLQTGERHEQQQR